MKENFNMLDEHGKNRIIVFTVITVLVAVFAMMGFLLVCSIVNNPENFFVSEPFEIDGADFAPLLSLMKAVLVGFYMMIFALVHLVFAWLIDLAAYIFFWIAALKKEPFVRDAEYILAKRVFTVILTISIAVLLFSAIFNLPSLYVDITVFFAIAFYIAWLMVPIWLFGYLFYIHKLKYKRQV